MSLSLNDLKLLALTYEIELENNGQKNINQSVLSVINSVTTSRAIKNKTSSPGINFLNSNTAKDPPSKDIKKMPIKDQILPDENIKSDVSDLVPEDNLNNLAETEMKSNNSNATQPDTTIFIEEDFPSLSISSSLNSSVKAPPLFAWASNRSVENKITSFTTSMLNKSTDTSSNATKNVILSNPPAKDENTILLNTTDQVSVDRSGTNEDSTRPTSSSDLSSSPCISSNESPKTTSRILKQEFDNGASKMTFEEDDGLNWINTSNIVSCKSSGKGMIGSSFITNFKSFDTSASGSSNIGCITSDLTMQNILLYIGLNIISLDFKRIHHIQQWVLRCRGCFHIHYSTEAIFCSKCGLNMLQRIAASRDKKTGELKLHLKKNYNPKSIKSNTSIPKPGKQGRFEGEILLREDQLLTGIWKQKVYQMKKEVKSAFGDDITSDFGLHINKFSNINSGVKNLQFKQKNKKSSRL